MNNTVSTSPEKNMFIDEKQKLIDEKSKVNIPTETLNGNSATEKFSLLPNNSAKMSFINVVEEKSKVLEDIQKETEDDSATDKFSLLTDDVKKPNIHGKENTG